MAAFPGHLCPRCGTKIFCDVTLSNREFSSSYIPACNTDNESEILEGKQEKRKKFLSKKELWQRKRNK